MGAAQESAPQIGIGAPGPGLTPPPPPTPKPPPTPRPTQTPKPTPTSRATLTPSPAQSSTPNANPSATATPTPNATPSAVATLLPLGDGKISYTAPAKGIIYLCNGFKAGGGGAATNGPWIEGKYWDPSKKIHVQGSVNWPDWSYSFVLNGDQREVMGNDLPPHPTGIFPIQPSDPAYKYDHNPNSIGPQSVLFSLPANPVVASKVSCEGGQVGIAITGVALFNGLDALLRDAVAHELQDSYNGHPQQNEVYHYHNISQGVLNLGITDSLGNTLVGYAFDGFGIYGPVENGKTLTNAYLDECHGHTSEIVWDGVPQQMYHYNATAEYPYTVGCYKGTPVNVPPLGGTH